MRDEYVGDVGDFGKYILLNKLSEISKGGIKIGINWYYNTRMEKDVGDGDRTHYLFNQAFNKYRNLSPDLFDKLKLIVSKNKRKIREVEKGNVLPQGCHCYSERIHCPLIPPAERGNDREWWFQKSQQCLMNSDVIFLDPDNGIPYYSKDGNKYTPNVRVTRVNAVKYAYMCEIKKYFDSGKSVIVYNHRDHEPAEKYREKFSMLKGFIKLPGRMSVLGFKKAQHRDYLLIPQKKHEDSFGKLSSILASNPFDFLFEIMK